MVRRASFQTRRLLCILAAKSRDHCMYHGSSSAACSGGNSRPRLLPPEQAAELLPWYMQWSRDLAAEMHQRCLVRNEARRTVTLPISYRPCDCVAEWRCEPHDACFIHDS